MIQHTEQLLMAKKGMGFNTNISNGITTVELPYKLIYENDEVNAQVVIVNRGSGFCISSVQWYSTKQGNYRKNL